MWPAKRSLLKQGILVLFGSLVIAAGSQIAIPLNPVPITLQTFAVMLIGCLYGARLGLMSVALYLAEGLMGLPVFAEWHAGIAVLLGPAGGYLIGFLPAVWVSGYLLEKGWAKKSSLAFCAALLGDLCILLLGVIVLAKWVGLTMAVQVGLIPFIGIELIKLMLLSLVIPFCWRRNKQA
ncbi:MAG: hypothetical protein A3E87_02485 [Gammaproteobacteria bacterium RIFCSPHIGHO2_12_FULL_35_23]|nr:MAG: hypothetical protein A3E87_02485 [Gammaproteobacteria bacterium RIFCSPHIGHO2_12_FULL_35_23]